jgi:hypothetical protein
LAKTGNIYGPRGIFTGQSIGFLCVPLDEMDLRDKFYVLVHTKAFNEMKAIVSKETLLSFQDYSQRFELYVDASDKQLGAVLMQGKKVLAFFSKKLTETQKKYGVGEEEMLSVIESLKEFRTMILGYPIDIYTDHKNWTHDKMY